MLAWLVGIGAAAATVLAIWRPQRVMSHLTGAGDSTSGLRLTLWHSAVEMLWDHPLFGVGLDNFLYRVQPSARRHVPGSGRVARAGSVAPAQRLPRLVAVAGRRRLHPARQAADALLPTRVAWLYQARGDSRPLVVGAVGAMVATLVHGSIDNSFFLPDLAALWWVTFWLVTPPERAVGGT